MLQATVSGKMTKVVDFVPLGALFGPGVPDPGLARFLVQVP